MVGMSFTSFLTLLIVGIVVAVVFHWILRYRFMSGFDALLGEVAVGWLGGWLGSPVLGHWLWRIGDVYVVPAILGAIVAIHLDVLCCKTLARIWAEGRTPMVEEKRPTRAAA
jgi:uncharacterized membrane protein YeaQ/YmgE (transglycosylase-associated protein family)